MGWTSQSFAGHMQHDEWVVKGARLRAEGPAEDFQ